MSGLIGQCTSSDAFSKYTRVDERPVIFCFEDLLKSDGFKLTVGSEESELST